MNKSNLVLLINSLFILEFSGFILTGYFIALDNWIEASIIFIVTFCLAMYVGEKIQILGKLKGDEDET